VPRLCTGWKHDSLSRGRYPTRLMIWRPAGEVKRPGTDVIPGLLLGGVSAGLCLTSV
jgi:hypothetical protein